MNGTPEHTMGAITARSPGAADHCVERSWQRSSKTLASDQRVDLVNLSPGELKSMCIKPIQIVRSV